MTTRTKEERASYYQATKERDKEKRAAQYKAWYEKNKVKVGIATKKRYQENIEEAKFYHIKRTYGITEEEYNALLIAQNNKCAICEEDLTKPVVDHCHETKVIRGILCNHCNLGIGHFKDNLSLLVKASQYLTNKGK